jgi:hypothetical protein
MTVAERAESGPSAARRRRRPRNRETAPRETIGVALLVLTLVGSALAFGAQQTWAIVTFSITSAGAALCLAPARLPRIGWVLAGLAVYTMLQVVPLPLGVLRWLSPSSASVWQGALVPLKDNVRFATLSVDPAATALEALKGCAYLCVLVAASGWRARRRSLRPALLVFGSALVVCLVTLLHGVLDVGRVYGLYPTFEVWRWTRGPLINGNNLAGYLNLGLFTGAGIWLARRGERHSQLLAASVPLLAVGTLLSGSRAGVVALALGVLLFAALVVRQGIAGRASILATLGVTSAAALALAVAGGGTRAWEVIHNADLGAKARVWRWSLALIRDFPVFGVGRGAYETAFLPYRQPIENGWTTIAAQVENLPLAWVCEWGILVGIGAWLGLGYVARRVARRALREPIAAGIAIGLFALLLQNLADFSLEIFGVAALALVAFSAADDAIDERVPVFPRVALPGAAGVLVWSVIVLATGSNPVQVDRRDASREFALVRAKQADAGAFDARLRGLILRHPGEAYFPLLGSVRATTARRDPLPWLGRALERSPLDANVHLFLSDALDRRGARPQAALHRRLAAMYDVDLRDRALTELAARITKPEEIARTFPRGLPGENLLDQLCNRLLPTLVIDCWREARSRVDSSKVKLGLANALLQAIENDIPPCHVDEGRGCEREAVALLDFVAKDGTLVESAADTRARLQSVRGEPAQAARTMLEHCPAGHEGIPCHARALDLALRSRDLRTLDVVTDRYALLICVDLVECARLHERVGRAYLELSAAGLALRQFTEAAKASPTAERWLLTAEAAVAARSPTAARRALEQATREQGPAPNQKRRVAAVEASLANPRSDE